jgi:hypothetical protein
VAWAARGIELVFQDEWRGPDSRGLLAEDPRVRTLLKVLVTYREVRHILPDRVSLDPHVDPHLLETMARFLGRQQWLIKSVEIR